MKCNWIRLLLSVTGNRSKFDAMKLHIHSHVCSQDSYAWKGGVLFSVSGKRDAHLSALWTLGCRYALQRFRPLRVILLCFINWIQSKHKAGTMTQLGTAVLNVSITSAVMVKPSTLYTIRAEYTECGRVWHTQRTFKEFQEFQDRLLGLLEAAECIRSETKSTVQSRKWVSFLMNSDFRRHQMLFTKSKKVVRQRLYALNQFLQSVLALLSYIRQKGHVATYFGMWFMVESFLGSRNTLTRTKSFRKVWWFQASSIKALVRPASMIAVDRVTARDDCDTNEHKLCRGWKDGYKKFLRSFLRNSTMERERTWNERHSPTLHNDKRPHSHPNEWVREESIKRPGRQHASLSCKEYLGEFHHTHWGYRTAVNEVVPYRMFCTVPEKIFLDWRTAFQFDFHHYGAHHELPLPATSQYRLNVCGNWS